MAILSFEDYFLIIAFWHSHLMVNAIDIQLDKLLSLF